MVVGSIKLAANISRDKNTRHYVWFSFLLQLGGARKQSVDVKGPELNLESCLGVWPLWYILISVGKRCSIKIKQTYLNIWKWYVLFDGGTVWRTYLFDRGPAKTVYLLEVQIYLSNTYLVIWRAKSKWKTDVVLEYLTVCLLT